MQVNAASGAAARAGLREGDVILSVANVAVVNVAGFEKIVADLDKTKPVNILYRRGEWAQYTVIRFNP